MLALPKTYTIPALTPIAMFWVHKLLYFFFIDVFHGIIIPLNMEIPWDITPPEVGEFYVRKPKITPRRPLFEESRNQIISVEDEKAAISEGHDLKIFKARERVGLYDNPQPSTSYQLPQVDCSPKLKPKPFQNYNFNTFKVHQLESVPLPRVSHLVADVEKGGRRTSIYCRTCAKKEKGKGKGKGKR